jgi:hypothetical protein
MKRRITSIPAVELPTEFSVVGEHQFDSGRPLLRDTDGHYFELSLEDGSVAAATLGAEWVMDFNPQKPTPHKAA